MGVVRVSIANVWKPKADLRCSSLVESLQPRVEKHPSRAHGLNSWRLRWSAWGLQNHRGPKHCRQYRSREKPSTSSSHLPSEGSVVGSSKGRLCSTNQTSSLAQRKRRSSVVGYRSRLIVVGSKRTKNLRIRSHRRTSWSQRCLGVKAVVAIRRWKWCEGVMSLSEVGVWWAVKWMMAVVR